MEHYDIIVVGGGFGGVASAISAARLGKNVCLVEKYNCLGGAAAYDLVLPFMYSYTMVNGKREPLACGIFLEIKNRLREIGGVCDGWDDCFSTEHLKLVLNRMAIESGVNLLFQAYVTDVTFKGGVLYDIEISSVEGKTRLSADYFVDATGDANLSCLCGLDFTKGRKSDGKTQPMTLSFRVGGVDMAKYDVEKMNALYKEHKSQGKISCPRENLLVFKTTMNGVLHFNTTRIIGLDPTKLSQLTNAEIEGREQMFEIFNFLKENFDAFENAYLLESGIQIGARESRNVACQLNLTGEEIISLARFDDAIAVCNYDIDIHSPDGEGTSHHYFKDGAYYQIPYRALVPKGAKNILVAGRCIGADHEAQASLRIMPTCAVIGQACGTALAICHSHKCNTMEVPVNELRDTLRQNGARID